MMFSSYAVLSYWWRKLVYCVNRVANSAWVWGCLNMVVVLALVVLLAGVVFV